MAATDGPYTSQEGSLVAMSAASSTDPDGDALTYDWDFGDGGTASSVSASHTYSQDGSYTVRLIATDIRGLADTITTTANVSNVAPAIGIDVQRLGTSLDDLAIDHDLADPGEAGELEHRIELAQR